MLIESGLYKISMVEIYDKAKYILMEINVLRQG